MILFVMCLCSSWDDRSSVIEFEFEAVRGK